MNHFLDAHVADSLNRLNRLNRFSRFSRFNPLKVWRADWYAPCRWGVLVVAGLQMGAAAHAHAQHTPQPPVLGVLVQLKPQAAAEVLPSSVVWRDTPQVQRERAQVAWASRHERESARLHAAARSAGVSHAGVSTAGSWLKLAVDVGTPQGLEATMRRLRLHPDVQAVVANERVQHLQSTPIPFIPNDPQFNQQWALQMPQSTTPAGINMPTAWGRWGSLPKANTSVMAVVDTGVRFDHPDLAGRLLPGYDFVSEIEYANDGNGRDSDASDPGDWVTRAETLTSTFRGCDVGNSNWHGTAIAGLMAASHSNGLGISGVYPQGQILPVRIAGKCGASLSDLLDGVRWAVGLPVAGVPINPHPARVINLSYGGSSACDNAYQSTINEVRAVGALVVTAAGNSGGAPTRPADCQGVIAVSATRSDGAKADYASFGPSIALAAPGGSGYVGSDYGLLTTLDAGRQGPLGASYGELTGTSFSAPLVAGVAGMMLAVKPSLGVDELDRLLRQAVRPHSQSAFLSPCRDGLFSQGVCNCTTSTCGSGLLDADVALQLLSAPNTTPATPTPTPSTTVPTPPSTSSNEATPTSSGGGGLSGFAWGLCLWLWLGVGVFSSRFSGLKRLKSLI